MNPLSFFSWMWKALLGRSVVFAGLFALTLMGLSVLGWVKWGLSSMGVHWLALLIVPSLLIAAAARKEKEWIPDEAERKKWARGLVFGSLIAAVLAAFLFPKPPSPKPDRPTSPRRIGPPGK